MCGNFLFGQKIPSHDRGLWGCGNYRSQRFAISWYKKLRTLEYPIGVHFWQFTYYPDLNNLSY